MIKIGEKFEINCVVTEDMTAKNMGSGSLPVFATPSMVAIMEQAACGLCEKYIDEDLSTVGTALNISHIAATVVGAPVKAVATVTAVEGRKLCFDVEAYDNAGLIGKGTHERFTVKIDKFMEKSQERKNLRAE